MKIALLTDGIYPYVIGGMQKHSFYLVKFFARQHVFVDLYHTNKSELDISKLACFTEEEKKYIRSFVVDFPAGGKFPGHYLRASFEYSERIAEIFKVNDKVDFIYAKGFTAWKLFKEKEKGYKCVPIGVNFHGYEMFQKPPSFRTWLEQRVLFRKPVLYNVRHSDYLFSYGGKITELIKSINPDHHKIIEIPTGIEADWLNEVPIYVNSPLRFVFIGRFERRKGIEELNAVLKKITPDSTFQFLFIGPIPENKQVKAPNIYYSGVIPDVSRIRQELYNSDVLVCPSHSEGMPNVILEGMASGLSIIASDVGAVNKMIAPDNGILIDPGSTSQLESAMHRLLKMDKDELKKMKIQSLLKIKRSFLWEVIILKTIEEIKKRINTSL
jgi:glycosyltransferase involved in cell wall biosynthesis